MTSRVFLSKVSEVAFFSLLLVASIGYAEAVFTVACFVLFFLLWSNGFRINKSLLHFLMPILFLFGLGIYGGVKHEPYDVLKDAWYLLKIIIFIAVGFYFMKVIRSFHALVNIVVLASVLLSIYHLSLIGLYGGFSDPGILFVLRESYGVSASLLTVIGLTLLSFFRVYIRINPVLYIIFLFLCGLSIGLSMSRTFLVVFFMIGLLMMSKRILSTSGLFFIGTTLSIIMLATSVGSDSIIVNKFQNSAAELNVKEYSSKSEINANWRGFEAFRAFQEYMSGSVVERVFGQGFGALIDLGFEMELGGDVMRFIPMTHNGYMYVLLKFGALGLFIFLYFIYKLIRRNKNSFISRHFEIAAIEKLISAIGLLILFTTLVISGIFNIYQLHAVLMLLGALLYLFTSYRERDKAFIFQ